MRTPMQAPDRFSDRESAATRSPSIIHAIVYDEGSTPAVLARSLVDAWAQKGWRVAGLVEDHITRSDRGRCDMVLHELTSGERVLISEYRGPQAQGCRLDAAALLRVGELVRSTLAEADILILNKFGKIECEGGGLRSVIVDALDRSLPIVIFVPRRNLDCWQGFAGPLAIQWELADLPLQGEAMSERLGLHRHPRQPAEVGHQLLSR
jgi:nucleoside-triphosphatase THEP1